jgi:hypothetical protein
MGDNIKLNAQTGLPYTARSEYFWVNCGQRRSRGRVRH